MIRCPRCESESTRIEYEGREDGAIVWTVHNCETCRFTWRDSEPGTTISPDKRESFFQIDPDDTDKYPIPLPLQR